VNLIFLSIIIVACFEKIFTGLEKINTQEKKLNARIKADYKKLTETQNILKNKNEELNQFAHIIAHDLKEPLRSMQAFAQLVIEKYSAEIPNKGQEFLNYIKTSSKRMALMLNSLLEFSQIGQDRKLSDFEVNSIVEELENDLTRLIQENNASIIYQDLPKISAYEIEFKQLLQNLISNAIKFKKENENIVVEIIAKELKEDWKFTLKDNGIGIAPNQKEKIFTIFHRLHKDRFEGTGLGLANCKKIVEMHGGKIWVDSKENIGSEFHFTIPK